MEDGRFATQSDYEKPLISDAAEQLMGSDSLTAGAGPGGDATWCQRVAAGSMGFTSNVFFLIVWPSSARIVTHFNKSGWLGAVNWSVTVCGLFAGYVNAWLSAREVSYGSRFVLNSIVNAVGLVVCGCAVNFWMACVGTIFIGFGCNFGESLGLGFFADIGLEVLVREWGTGMSIAGILGSGYATLCAYYGDRLRYDVSFYCLLAFIPVYFASFWALRSREPRLVRSLVSCGEMWRIFLRVAKYFLWVDAGYFALYSIAGYGYDCGHDPGLGWAYACFSLCQHGGVLVGTQVLRIGHFRWLWIPVLSLYLLLAVWTAQCVLRWMKPNAWQFVFAFLTGVPGGLVYVAAYDCLLRDSDLTTKEKEVGANLTSVTTTTSDLLGAVFTLVAEQTFLKAYVPP